MKIILQMYINENLGDDLFIDIIANKYPNTNFTIYGIGYRMISSVYKKKYKNVDIVPVSRLNNKINTICKVFFRRDIILENILKEYDGIITLGGSVFIDSPLQFEAFKANVLADVRIHALKVKKPTFVIGANFGPVYHDKFVEKYFEYFSNCINVCFRDTNSKVYYKELKNVVSSTDVVFNYKRKNVAIKNKTVGISIIDLNNSSHSKISKYKKEYEENIIKVINDFISLGYGVKIYSFCNNQGDNTASYNIIENVDSKKNVKIVEYQGMEIDEFVKDFASNEYIIATRFHSMILGLIHQQKVYPIVYDIKTQNVIDELKITNYCTLDDIDKMKIDDILEIKNYTGIENIQKKASNQFYAFEKYYKLVEE